MPILSLQNPITYIIVVLLIGVAYALYRIATKKNEEEKTELAVPIPLQTPIVLEKPIALQKPKKYYTRGVNCNNIIFDFFNNGSCLVVMNDGRLIRTKTKYC